ncbi:hypothetical protein FGO68_gene14515 [Halteria grandinella]|uniref:Uncharacterized protein n=1 Tax=Halteria grandinella TaxID=5974 RepID=A0A8J8NG78_HALGN|nr:hypothetical protein FGO68_gene14515 [Halteria grandinella]
MMHEEPLLITDDTPQPSNSKLGFRLDSFTKELRASSKKKQSSQHSTPNSHAYGGASRNTQHSASSGTIVKAHQLLPVNKSMAQINNDYSLMQQAPEHISQGHHQISSSVMDYCNQASMTQLRIAVEKDSLQSEKQEGYSVQKVQDQALSSSDGMEDGNLSFIQMDKRSENKERMFQSQDQEFQQQYRTAQPSHLHSVDFFKQPKANVASKFNLLKNVIELSYQSNNTRPMYSTGKSLELSATPKQISQKLATILSQQNASDSSEVQSLKQQIEVLKRSELVLLSKLENQQRKIEGERRRWDQAMGKMQGEMEGLNEVINRIMAEKRVVMKCKCRPRIRDLERQVLDLHRQLYFYKKGNPLLLDSENDSCKENLHSRETLLKRRSSSKKATHSPGAYKVEMLPQPFSGIIQHTRSKSKGSQQSRSRSRSAKPTRKQNVTVKVTSRDSMGSRLQSRPQSTKNAETIVKKVKATQAKVVQKKPQQRRVV